MKDDRCCKCNMPVFFVQRYMGDWIALDKTLIDKGPRYSLHSFKDGSPVAFRENTIRGYKNHVCPKSKPTIGGHTPQLF